MTCHTEARRARQHHTALPAATLARIKSCRERVAISARQLVVQPDLQRLRGHRRPLLRRMEQAGRSAVEDHVNWNA